MKNNEYYIVHQSILPDYFEQVIKVRELINDKGFSVSDACKMENISRSTYYKYKDFIFRPAKNTGTKALFSIKTADEKAYCIQNWLVEKVSYNLFITLEETLFQ